MRRNLFRNLKAAGQHRLFEGKQGVLELDAIPFSRGKRQSRESGVLKGTYALGDSVEGVAAVIESPSQFGKMQKGMILVAPATNPHWDVLFRLAAGVVVENGSPLSHPAIKASEYGIAALLGVEKACRRIHDGDRIAIDPQTKCVKILSKCQDGR